MRYIVDENGVITGELREGDRIVRAKSIEHIIDKEPTVYENFCILNTSEYKAVMKELGRAARAILSQLIPYVQYTTCLLAFSNGKAINSRHIKDITGFSQNTVEKGLRELVAEDILYKGKNSREVQWYINPYIVHRGRLTNKTLQAMFRNYRRRS